MSIIHITEIHRILNNELFSECHSFHSLYPTLIPLVYKAIVQYRTGAKVAATSSFIRIAAPRQPTITDEKSINPVLYPNLERGEYEAVGEGA